MAWTQSRFAAERVAGRCAAPLPGTSLDTGFVPRAQAGHCRGPAQSDRAAPDTWRRGRDRRVLLPLAEGAGAGAARATGVSLRQPSSGTTAGNQVVRRALAVGELQSPRRDPPQLEAGAAAAAHRRLRRGPRGGALGRAQPFGPLL